MYVPTQVRRKPHTHTHTPSLTMCPYKVWLNVCVYCMLLESVFMEIWCVHMEIDKTELKASYLENYVPFSCRDREQPLQLIHRKSTSMQPSVR